MLSVRAWTASVRLASTATSRLGLAMGAHVLVEEHVLEDLAEGAVIGDAPVEIEVGIDDLLDHLLDLLVEREADVLAGVDSRAGVESGVGIEPFHHLTEGHPVLRTQVEPEALVQLGDGLFVLSPDCEECASSTITANRLPGSSPISFAITGNF